MLTYTLMPKLHSDSFMYIALCKQTVLIRPPTQSTLTFTPPWHQSLYRCLSKFGVKCLKPGSDSLLHVGVFWK